MKIYIHEIAVIWKYCSQKAVNLLETFYCKTKIITGSSGEILREQKIQSLLLVADPYFAENGIARTLIAEAAPGRSRIFSEVVPDPSVELAAAGVGAMKEFQPDTGVALGGGSAIDCAKAMVYFYEKPVTLIAIPTTSGSGSEVTDFSVLTHEAAKHPLIDPQICPDVAILDEKLLKDLPKKLIADTGFDVLSHALEGYVATGAGVISDALAREAFCLAYAYLPASYRGNRTLRGKIHMASTMAGMAFSQAGLGLCHAMSHSLGGVFHVPHGRLNAILLPAVVECNALMATGKYAKLARAAGINGAADTVAVRNLRNGLIRLRRDLELPETLQQAGISPRNLRQKTNHIVETTLHDPCLKTNPITVEDFMVRRILEQVAGHG